ncbi:hypothetical protein [Fodinicola feengrottensis]|uniref:Uncharacterized protein n=1 Tax=Fodinicola feengrottensis TaxID=435914 RepID=A0ABN2J027_9ACTN|nr:hypothetical protein [Fodinicola feengrottensis]
MTAPDADREVPLADDDLDILPDTTSDERDEGWGDHYGDEAQAADQRLLEDRPPHW